MFAGLELSFCHTLTANQLVELRFSAQHADQSPSLVTYVEAVSLGQQH